MPAEALRVLVTGAAGQIAYSLLYQISSGYVFGPDQPIILHLLDIAPAMGVLNGVVMELHDCAMPLIADIVATDDPAVAFKDIDAAFLVGAMPRKEGMERKDLLAANVKIFKAQENFSAMTRLDQNRASAQLALKAGVAISEVKNVIIWGNHSSTKYPDAAQATIGGKPAPEVRVHGVFSDGSYGTAEGVMFSFPVAIKDGKWSIVQGLSISDFARGKLDATGKELCEERDEAMAVCQA
ncbi:hypothetical protein TCAL_16543 [Tigriopus californicus]|uniref:Malate dehydrogenase n=1 Tax=Tigriopus californicus TaxID=6832 RepID=A0A553NDK0_TIGCA|nr:hypothetical protein TCAL_16543 [Tigriopus californicus]